MLQSSAKQNLPFWLLILTLVIAVLIVPLVTQGVSGDGMVYSSVAYNMAHGIGSFWQPVYTKTWFPVFYEHPPLAMFLQSLLFRILGDGFYVEKIYSGLMVVLTWFFLIQSWRLINPGKYSYWFAWLIILVWLTLLLNVQAAKNNVIENTLVVFIAANIYCLLYYSKKGTVIYFVFSALLIAAGFFTNGLEALYPLGFFVVYGLVFRQISLRQILLKTILLVLLVASLIGCVLLNGAAYHAIKMYFTEQVFATFTHARQGAYIGWYHFYGILMLLNNLYPMVILSLIFFYFRKRVAQVSLVKMIATQLQDRWCYFFLLMGCIAVLPILVSSRQQAHYLLPAAPMFILAFAQLLAAEGKQWMISMNTRSGLLRIFTVTCFLLFLVSLVYAIHHAGTIRKDKELIEDVQMIGKVVKPGAIISIAPDLTLQWNLYAYIYRYQQISLVTDYRQAYLLTSKHRLGVQLSGYQPVVLPLHLFNLYQKIPGSAATALKQP